MGQEVETEVPRAAEAGLYTGEDKGRLCTLVRAQLVCVQHADVAPGAVQRSWVRAREKEKIKRRLDTISSRDTNDLKFAPADLSPELFLCLQKLSVIGVCSNIIASQPSTFLSTAPTPTGPASPTTSSASGPLSALALFRNTFSPGQM
ncbi:hypothetical protein IEO21_09777 [Rhodonia placenta]|uniref:Uncharacterized protein n=1 Tax=Rhodonia placenta TaxID=104341 RepID=A0A8H7NTP5_9APHY|nr:hypothetical protein IEO21_09777 [Postia placenta]